MSISGSHRFCLWGEQRENYRYFVAPVDTRLWISGKTVNRRGDMPLTKKGSKIMEAMMKQYGDKKGEEVFYASRNKGNIKGVDPESSKGEGKDKKKGKGK